MGAALPIISVASTLIGGVMQARAANQAAKASAAGQLYAARAQQQAGEIQAQLQEQQANYDAASAQQAMFREREAKEKAIGRLRSAAGASGFGLESEDIIDVFDEIKAFGGQREQAALTQGLAARQAGRYAAAGTRYTGAAGVTAAQYAGQAGIAAAQQQGIASTISSFGTMANRFSSSPTFGTDPYQLRWGSGPTAQSAWTYS